MTIYSIDLTMEEGELIVQALAERPFREVFATIASLNRQANGYAQSHTVMRHAFALNADELSLAIRALGSLPFDRVCGLITTLNAQIRSQHLQHGSGT